jgi:CTP-dependent riboflavin kinase
MKTRWQKYHFLLFPIADYFIGIEEGKGVASTSTCNGEYKSYSRSKRTSSVNACTLEKHGLITRSQGREKIVSLTDKGKQLKQELLSMMLTIGFKKENNNV